MMLVFGQLFDSLNDIFNYRQRVPLLDVNVLPYIQVHKLYPLLSLNYHSAIAETFFLSY